jgi:hypothetical protein
MPIDKAAALRQMDDVLARFRQVDAKVQWDNHGLRYYGVSNTEVAEVVALITHAVERFRPPGTAAYGSEALAKNGTNPVVHLRMLGGTLAGLRADYAADRLRSFRELVHADLFADFLEMADHLLEQGYKGAAAVTAGAVLEEHLRKLCGLHSVATTFTDSAGKTRPKKLDTMNADLAKASAYGKIEQQSVTAWAAVRNAAAHGDATSYDEKQAQHMIDGIRDFILRHPA